METEGKDIYDLAHEMAELALMEYGKPHCVQRWLSRAPKHTQEIWHREEIEPRAIDREVSTAMHMTHMGNSSKADGPGPSVPAHRYVRRLGRLHVRHRVFGCYVRNPRSRWTQRPTWAL